MSAATKARPGKATAASSSFEAGRDLAIQMLEDGDALDSTDAAEPYRWMRGGAAQARFAVTYLQKLAAHPELIEGFAAVLSARLGCGDHAAPNYFALPIDEYEAGEVGADGTALSPDAAGAPAGTLPEPSTIDLPPDDAERRLALAQETNHEVEKLAEGMERLLRQRRDEDFLMYHGMLTRIQQLANITYFAMRIHGNTPEEEDHNWGDLSKIETLEAAYRGLL